MTKEEVDNKFKDLKLRFEHYYKHLFTFIGISEDGYTINASYGKDASDIYTYSISANEKIPFIKCDEWTVITIYDRDGKSVFNYDNY